MAHEINGFVENEETFTKLLRFSRKCLVKKMHLYAILFGLFKKRERLKNT